MKVRGSWIRISIIVTIAVFLVFSGSIVLTVSTLANSRIVHIRSGSMVNGDRASIGEGDLVRMASVGSLDDVRTYVESTEEDYRKGGSFGDVLFFRPNGDRDATLIVHRAVVCIYFNSSTYDPVSRTGGGFDVPSLGYYNSDRVLVIDDYEWPKSPTSSSLGIDLGLILKSFRNRGVRPHSGFITKGDSNKMVDQTAVYTDEGVLLEPVTVDWIRGRLADKLEPGPAFISIGVSSLILAVMVAVTIVLIIANRAAHRKDSEQEHQYNEAGPQPSESENRLTAVELDRWIGDQS
ncbi:MAG: hypothetical protein ACMUHM_03445 [Thermoplasmatota archaeon]